MCAERHGREDGGRPEAGPNPEATVQGRLLDHRAGNLTAQLSAAAILRCQPLGQPPSAPRASAASRRAPMRQAARMTIAVTETMIVEMALISGVTPNLTLP